MFWKKKTLSVKHNFTNLKENRDEHTGNIILVNNRVAIMRTRSDGRIYTVAITLL